MLYEFKFEIGIHLMLAIIFCAFAVYLAYTFSHAGKKDD